MPARLATLVAVAGSAASNGAWAWIRTGGPGGAGHDRVAVALGVAVPVAANLAFEVLLAELRRQVQRGRGLPAPVAIPQPRLVRVALAPWTTLREWRALVLELTHPTPPPRPHPPGHDLPVTPTIGQLRTHHPAPADRPRQAVAAPPAEHAADPTAARVAATAAHTTTDQRGNSSDTPDHGDSPRPGPATDARSAASTRSDHPREGQAEPSPTGNHPRASAAHPARTTAHLAAAAASAAERSSRMLELVPARTPADRTSRPAPPGHADDQTGPGASGPTVAAPPPAQPAPETPERDPRVEQLLTLLREGEQLSGVQAARVLECSDRTGRRLLRIAQEHHDQTTGRTG